MGIDPLDEDDVPTAGSDSAAGGADSPAAVGWDSGADPDADRMAYNVKYREDVENEYLAAWDEAAPGFRAAVEAHERKNPRPEWSQPTGDASGFWRSEGELELKPWQNAEVNRGCERIRDVGEKVIIPAIRDIEAEDTSRQLVGFQSRFKEADRLKEKVAERLRSKPGRTPTEVLEGIPDAVRFTFQYPHGSYVDGVRKDIERLEARGFIQLERRNTWTSDQYKGINSRWCEPKSGIQFEVQFHTRISYEAKELTHRAYERIRGSAKDSERAELKEFQRRVCAMIPLPPGVTEYEDYLRKEHDG